MAGRPSSSVGGIPGAGHRRRRWNSRPMRELWRSIGFTSGARIYSVAAGSVSLVITARALGPSGRGAVAAAITWAALFSTVGYLSLGQVAIHRVAGRPVSEWLGPILAALLAVTAAVSVVGWLVAGGIFV